MIRLLEKQVELGVLTQNDFSCGKRWDTISVAQYK